MNALAEAGSGRRVASTWDEGSAYESFMGRWSRLIAASFVEWLDIAPGGIWLDVGCGTGALTSAICDMADPVAVTGMDASPEFVSHAADLSCTDTASYVVGEASSIPFVDGIFDVAVSGLVLNFLPDPVAALNEQSRVVAPSGTIAAYVWDYAEGMRLLRHFWDVARRVVPSAVALDEAVRFTNCDSQRSRAHVRGCRVGPGGHDDAGDREHLPRLRRALGLVPVWTGACARVRRHP